MMTMSAPRPVKTPPTEVASRQPWAVVSNSGTAARCGERRVGKIPRYQSAATMCRQSRDNLSARSCPPGYARDGPIAVKPGGDAKDLRRGRGCDESGRHDTIGRRREALLRF